MLVQRRLDERSVASQIHSDSDPEARLSPSTRRKLALSRERPDRHYSVQKMQEGIFLVGYGGLKPRPPMYNPNLLTSTLATRLRTARPGILWKDQGVPIHEDTPRREGPPQPKKMFVWRNTRALDLKNEDKKSGSESRKSRAENHLALLEKAIGGDTSGYNKLALLDDEGNERLYYTPQSTRSLSGSNKSMDVRSTSIMSGTSIVREMHHGKDDLVSKSAPVRKILNDDMPKIEEAMLLVRRVQKQEYLDRLNMEKDPRYKKKKAGILSTTSPTHSSKYRKHVTSMVETMGESHEEMIERHHDLPEKPMTAFSLPYKWKGANFDNYHIGIMRRKNYVPVNLPRREKTTGVDWMVSTQQSHRGSAGTISKDLRPVTAGLNEQGTSQRKQRGRVLEPSEFNILKVLPLKLDGLMPVEMANKVSKMTVEDYDSTSMNTRTILSSDSRLGDLASIEDVEGPDTWGPVSAPVSPSKTISFAQDLPNDYGYNFNY